MDDNDVTQHLQSYAQKYASLITVEDAAAIARVPPKTIYHWSSLGKLDRCKARQGKHVRFTRDCFVLFLLDASPSELKRSA